MVQNLAQVFHSNSNLGPPIVAPDVAKRHGCQAAQSNELGRPPLRAQTTKKVLVAAVMKKAPANGFVNHAVKELEARSSSGQPRSTSTTEEQSDGGTHGGIQPLILPDKPSDPPRHFAPRRRPRPTRQSRSEFGGTIKRMSNLPKSRVNNRKSAEQAGYRANRKRIKDVYRR